MAQPGRLGGGDGQDTSRGRGVGRPPRVPREPEGSDRFQQMQDQITALTAVVQQLVQQQAAAQATSAPSPVQPPEPLSEEPVIPPVAPVPPVATTTTSGAAATTFGDPPVAATGTSSRPTTPAAIADVAQAERARAKAVLLEFKKFQPPTFDGTSDDDWAVERWVLRMEKLFRDVFTEDRDRVHLAAHCLEGEADQWWTELLRDQYGGSPEPSWQIFKDAIYDRYLNEVTKQGLERQLETIHQGERTVREYEREFSRICALIPQAVRDEQRKIRLFSQGLRPDIRRLLSSLDISHYRNCVKRALAVQADIVVARAERQAAEKGKEKKRPYFGDGGGSSSSKKPPRYPRSQDQTMSVSTCSQQRAPRLCVFCGGSHRAVTCDQRHGRCYKCGQAGHIVANCPQRSELVQSTASVSVASAPAVSSRRQSPAPSAQPGGQRQSSGGRVYALTTTDDPPVVDLTGMLPSGKL